MKLIEKVAQKAIQSLLRVEMFGWPPTCAGAIYQPERPVLGGFGDVPEICDKDLCDNDSEKFSRKKS